MITEWNIFNSVHPDLLLNSYSLEFLKAYFELIYMHVTKADYIQMLIERIYKKYRRLDKINDNLYYDWSTDQYITSEYLLHHLHEYSIMSISRIVKVISDRKLAEAMHKIIHGVNNVVIEEV